MNAASAITAALREINDHHGTAWQLVERLAGGYSAGAHKLTDGHGLSAVLKVHPKGVPAQRVTATARVIEHAIAAGWKTPRWLASGLLRRGDFYVVQEFIDGERSERLTAVVLESLLATNRRQAGIRPDIDRDWSAYVLEVVFRGGFGYAERMRQRAETSSLLCRLEVIAGEVREPPLPTTDLVHGDFTLDNAVFSEGQAYMVDADFVGKGSRAIDVAILLVQAGTADLDASAASLARLRKACTNLVGTDGLFICVAARIMGLVDFGLNHWPNDIHSFVARCHALIDSLVVP